MSTFLLSLLRHIVKCQEASNGEVGGLQTFGHGKKNASGKPGSVSNAAATNSQAKFTPRGMWVCRAQLGSAESALAHNKECRRKTRQDKAVALDKACKAAHLPLAYHLHRSPITHEICDNASRLFSFSRERGRHFAGYAVWCRGMRRVRVLWPSSLQGRPNWSLLSTISDKSAPK